MSTNKATKVCAPRAKLFWFGELLLKVQSEILKYCEDDH
jgi:hypothetical protein